MKKWIANLSLVFLAFSFSTFGFFSRVLSSELTVFQQMFFRNGAALILCTLLCTAFGRNLSFSRLTRRDLGVFLLRGLFLYMLGVALNILAVNLTTLGNVTLIAAIPFAALWGVVLFGERMTLYRVGALFLGLTGAFFIAVSDLSNPLSWGRGEIYAIISAAAFSLGMVSVRWHSKSLSVDQITQGQLLTCVILCAFGSLAQQEPLPSSVSSSTLALGSLAGAILYLNICTANFSFRNTTALVAGSILTLESVFALALGYFIYGEIPSLQSIFGGGLICASTLLITLWSKRK